VAGSEKSEMKVALPFSPGLGTSIEARLHAAHQRSEQGLLEICCAVREMESNKQHATSSSSSNHRNNLWATEMNGPGQASTVSELSLPDISHLLKNRIQHLLSVLYILHSPSLPACKPQYETFHSISSGTLNNWLAVT